ncbi:SDR family NAD(P)-dependent oxidoreductase [Microbacterium saperdae]|uniref:NAD(P)-dependent dehydrogenase (Short-subunit alcohol dehydrogenase family) n=1 Tax=Microbacterium saperdae TaxID=69368 RepID=A0A543BIW6_9MICO|nr:SDR family oxidoreductase [Microbacterium saperdae]TQL84756.1 NAD(P)-dependent dehydrogenase (short-subunit alcohol dehydrogenase family) [Microbacterium saperdae]GGM64285.1 oxidoreductase [Microbacterium saperdae]
MLLLTGAAGGIGRAIAHRLMQDPSAALILVDRDEAGLRDLDDRLGGSSRVRLEAVDITDEEAVSALFARAAAEWGGVDVLINNAAYAYDESLLDTDPARWDEQIAVVLRSVYLCSRAALPHMRGRGGGVIVSMSSVNAHQYFGNEAYSAAKAAVESLTRSMAVRYGPDGVRAVALGIGTVITSGAWQRRQEQDPQIIERMSGWYPLRRLGTPDDVAALVEFVASDAASWITGTTLMIDGGLQAGNARLADDVLGFPQESALRERATGDRG